MFFSVIIPVYNRAHRLPKVLESLQQQTFTDFEVIIVDDCSTDNSFEVASRYANSQIRVFRNSQNAERCVTRNNGIAIASGTYICFLDSDDYHLPNHLEVLHANILQHGAPVAYFFTNAWDETENGLRTERCCPPFVEHNPYTYFLRYTVNPQRWAIHRYILETIQFDPQVIICEDMDTSLRILAHNHPIIQIPERTTVYVAANDSFTHSDSQKAEKELLYLQRIFAKKELQGKLPNSEKARLLSMCYYFIATKAYAQKQYAKVLVNGIKSFFLYPKGYNGKTNKPLFVIMLYSFPIIGYCVRKLVSFFKR